MTLAETLNDYTVAWFGFVHSLDLAAPLVIPALFAPAIVPLILAVARATYNEYCGH